MKKTTDTVKEQNTTPSSSAERGRGRFLFTLFFTMLKIGLFTFGGGYAMIALLERELVAKRGWIDREEFLDMAAIAESTPGPVAINAATYVGYHTAGVPGALCATIAVCIPSFVIIYLISLFFDAFLSLTYVQYAFAGIKVCVVYLIGSAGIRMLRDLRGDRVGQVFFLLTALAAVAISLFSWSFSTVFLILIAGAAGVVLYLLRRLTHPGEDRTKVGDGDPAPSDAEENDRTGGHNA